MIQVVVQLFRIQLLADKLLPPGWRTCRVVSPASSPSAVDSPVLNKVRCALPMVDLVRGFHGDCRHVSEKSWRDMRTSLLRWPLTRTMALTSPDLVTEVWGFPFGQLPPCRGIYALEGTAHFPPRH